MNYLGGQPVCNGIKCSGDNLRLFFYVPFKKGEDTHLINCIVQSVYLGNGPEILPL